MIERLKEKDSPAKELVKYVGNLMLSKGNEPIEVHLVSSKHEKTNENILEIKIVLMNANITRDFVKDLV